MVNQYEHDIALKQQSIETLEKYVKEVKDNIVQIQLSTKTNMDL